MSVENTPTQGTGEVSPPEDFAAYAEYRRTGELPKAVEETPSDDAADEPAQEPVSDSETDSDLEQETEESEDEERDEKGRFKSKRGGVQKRISYLTSEVRELKAQLAAKADPGVASPKVEQAKADEGKPAHPKLNNFETYEEYETAVEQYQDKLTDWKLNQREKQRVENEQRRAVEEKQASAQKAWSESVNRAAKKHADFGEVLESVQDVQLTEPLQLAIMDGGAELAYALGKNRAELERIAKLSPVAAIRELGKFEAKLSPSQAPQKKTQTATKAPAPPQPVGGKSTATVKPLREVDDYAEYRARRMKGERV